MRSTSIRSDSSLARRLLLVSVCTCLTIHSALPAGAAIDDFGPRAGIAGGFSGSTPADEAVDAFGAVHAGTAFVAAGTKPDTPAYAVLPIPPQNAATFLVVNAPDMSAADDSSRLRLFTWMANDIVALGRAAFTPRFALYAAGTVGGTFALAWSDDELIEGMHDIYTGEARNVLEVLDYLGGPKINLPVLALAGGAMVTNNIKFQDAAFTSLQTLVYAGLIGYGLKGIFGRARPEWTDPYAPYEFFDRTGKNPFSHEGNSSYPSGHAIAAFGIITPWVLYYPSPFTYALYVLPVGTSMSRLALDKHWATDLVVGAAIGISMGRWLTHQHRRDRREERDRVRFSVVEDGRLFSLRVSLD